VLVGLLPLGCTAFIKPIFYLQKLQAVKKTTACNALLPRFFLEPDNWIHYQPDLDTLPF
jgi:hypothetical protein